MKKVNKFIKKFNGKKTTIGAICLFVAAIPHLSEYIGVNAVDIIEYVGMAFTAVGIVHKGAKALNK